jgi:hypothetical protein
VKYKIALGILKKKFELDVRIFTGLPEARVIEWATQIVTEGQHYALRNQQHSFLVGQIRSF